MISTKRTAAESAAAKQSASSSKGVKAWFMRQPTWLRVTLIIVAVLILPAALSLAVGIVKGVMMIFSKSVASVKTRFSKPIVKDPPPVSDKANLESK